MKNFFFMICIGFCITGCDQSNSIAGSTIDCNDNQDCEKHQICNLNAGRCVDTEIPEHCNNKELDDTEADIDCGGICKRTCKDGQNCQNDSDCASHNCHKNKCIPKKCNTDDDCEKGLCDNHRICTTCTDKKKNGLETAIDCGGKHCSPCSEGLACSKSDDCMPGLECSQKHICIQAETVPEASCTDKKKNGLETDVDCGGTCPACANGNSCAGNNDCTTEYCKEYQCTEHECSNAEPGQIEISEIFTNPDPSEDMLHSTSKQQKFIELHNNTDKNLRLDNLILMLGDKKTEISGCIQPKKYLVLHQTGTPLEALASTGIAIENDDIDDAIQTNGTFVISLRHHNTRIHSASVPPISEAGISAALPPSGDRQQDADGNDILVPHNQIKADDVGEHPYSPGMHNQVVVPVG